MNWFRWGPVKDLFKDHGAHAGLGNDSTAAQQLETLCRWTRQERFLFAGKISALWIVTSIPWY
jgi:hypothetical protein